MDYTVRQPGDLGRAVAEFRAVRGMTQEELAERVGLHRTYLSKLEQGDVPGVVERLVALFKALDLTVTIAMSDTEGRW